MDLERHAHYVALAMEWLLILSAMLSAVTGAFSGVRTPEARVAQAEAATGARLVVAAVEQAAVAAAPALPANVAPAAEVPVLADLAVPPAVPLYADRLIE